MLLRRAVLAAALASAAAYSPVAGSLRSLEAPRRSAVRAKSDDEETIKPPIGFRPLSDQEVVDKLNGVPTFSVVNSAGQVVATPDAEGNLRASFYLDLSEAQATFEGIRTANPGVDVNLHVAPLGSVWALSEWDEPLGDDDDGRDAAAAEEAADLESAKEPGEVGAGAVRLCASASEVEAVGSLLRQSPGPPLLRRRNVKEGPVPLFGSDAIRFKESADSEDDLMPLFFRRQDLASAWVASGGDIEKDPPPVQVTDLRTLAWQMKFDRTTDWRPMTFVAADDAIAFVEAQQEGQAATKSEGRGKGKPKLSRADNQGLIFGGGSGPK